MNDSVVLYGVGGYLLLTVALGLWASRAVETGADFIVAGRRLGLWLSTSALFATWFGGGTCIGAAGQVYENGLLGVIADPFGAALCLFLAGWFYIRPLRRMGLLTVADFFRDRFGKRAERVAALLQVPPFIGWVAAQLVAIGTVLEGIGLDQTLGILIGFGVVISYTVTGGMWSVSVTDVMQAVVLTVGLVVLLPIALSAAGGWSAVSAALPAGHTDFFPETSFHGWMWYVQGWLVIGLGSIPSQDLLQRSFSAKNDATAASSAYLSGALYLSVGLVPVTLGLIARVMMPDLANPEMALPALGRELLGPVGLAVFVGALLSAILSTAASALLAPASVFSENLLRPLRPGMDDAGLLRTTRTSVAVFAVIALLLALEFRNVYVLFMTAMEAGLAGLAAPFTAGLYWKRVDERAANASMLGGTAAWIVFKMLTDEWPADLLGFCMSILILALMPRAEPTVLPARA